MNQSVKHVELKCRKCAKWFDIGKHQADKLEQDWRQNVTFNRVVLCPSCFTENVVPPIGAKDKVDAPIEQCTVQHVVLHKLGDPQVTSPSRPTLIERRNELLRGIGFKAPVYTSKDVGKNDLKRAIHELENPPAPPPVPPTPATTAELLKRLNVIRAKQSRTVLKAWKGSRDALEKELARAQTSIDHISITKGPTVIAEGAETKRFETSLHTNKYQKAVDRMSKEQDKERNGDASRKVKVTSTGKDTFKATRSPDGPAKKAEEKIERKQATAKPAGEFITPADLGGDPRKTRAILRKHENKIPKAWRTEHGRWSFKPAHKSDLAKFVKERSE